MFIDLPSNRTKCNGTFDYAQRLCMHCQFESPISPRRIEEHNCNQYAIPIPDILCNTANVRKHSVQSSPTPGCSFMKFTHAHVVNEALLYMYMYYRLWIIQKIYCLNTLRAQLHDRYRSDITNFMNSTTGLSQCIYRQNVVAPVGKSDFDCQCKLHSTGKVKFFGSKKISYAFLESIRTYSVLRSQLFTSSAVWQEHLFHRIIKQWLFLYLEAEGNNLITRVYLSRLIRMRKMFVY